MLLANRPDGVVMPDQFALSSGRGFGDTAGRSSPLLGFRVKGE